MDNPTEAKVFFKMLGQVAQLTDDNSHTHARLKIAAHFGQVGLQREFQFLIAGHNVVGFLPHWADDVRNEITGRMLHDIKNTHGEDARKLCWGCL